MPEDLGAVEEPAIPPGLLSRTPLRDRAVEVLCDLIVSGTLTSGAGINGGELAAYQGISRGPFREATQRLGSDGLAEFRQPRGAFVKDIADEDLRDTLEVQAANLADVRATDQDVVDSTRC
jgi:DNA-binding GntR family transcriptional regulator